MTVRSSVRPHISDIGTRLALYGAVIGVAASLFFIVRLLSVGFEEVPYLGAVVVSLMLLLALAPRLFIRRRLLLTVDPETRHYRPLAGSYRSDRDSQRGNNPPLEVVEADVVEIAGSTRGASSIPRGAKTLLILTMRKEAAHDIIASLEKVYQVYTKDHGRIGAKRWAWTNVLLLVGFQPIASISSLLARLFVSFRL